MTAILKLTFVLPLGIARVSSNRDIVNHENGRYDSNAINDNDSGNLTSELKSDGYFDGGSHKEDISDNNECPTSVHYSVDSQDGTLFRSNLKNDQQYLVVPCIFYPKSMSQTSENKRKIGASDFSIAKDWQLLKRPRSYIDDNSLISASNIMPSPFPMLDAFVLAHRSFVSAGKAPNGHLTGWQLYTSSKSSMPGIYPGAK